MFEFEFFLAGELRMTVADLRGRMSNAEFVAWSVYHGRRAQEREMADKRARRR